MTAAKKKIFPLPGEAGVDDGPLRKLRLVCFFALFLILRRNFGLLKLMCGDTHWSENFWLYSSFLFCAFFFFFFWRLWWQLLLKIFTAFWVQI